MGYCQMVSHLLKSSSGIAINSEHKSRRTNKGRGDEENVIMNLMYHGITKAARDQCLISSPLELY